MKVSSAVRPLLLIAALAAISGGSAAASLYWVPAFSDAITAFNAADLDLSGSLSNVEFSTTLPSTLSRKSQAKSFRKADLNRSGSIQANEFLIFRRVIRPKDAVETWFYRADVSIDGALSFEEFISGYKAKVSLVSIRRDFLQADVDHSGTLILQEYSNFRHGLTVPHDFTVFELADFDASGQLTLVEFGYAYSQSAAKPPIQARFVLLDDNGDGVLTTSEWNPGVVR